MERTPNRLQKRRTASIRMNPLSRGLVLACLLGVGLSAPLTSRPPLIAPNPQKLGMCSRTSSGAAVISDQGFSSEGEFEFKIRPSFSEGVVTAIGLADDSLNPKDPYVQLIFDTLSYTTSKFAIVVGSGPDQQSASTFMVNVNDIFPNKRRL